MCCHVSRNPCGRTGLAGRGTLGKWGPNHAADPIVTRLVWNEVQFNFLNAEMFLWREVRCSFLYLPSSVEPPNWVSHDISLIELLTRQLLGVEYVSLCQEFKHLDTERSLQCQVITLNWLPDYVLCLVTGGKGILKMRLWKIQWHRSQSFNLWLLWEGITVTGPFLGWVLSESYLGCVVVKLYMGCEVN